MKQRTRLELTWIGKHQRARLEPRILLEDPELSVASRERISEHDQFENLLIEGDNLLALRSLEQDYTGRIRCVCIDPPYNTGSAFTQYDDGLEHSIWLSLMQARLEILRRLLTRNGSIWICIDDVEAHYLKVLCDEIFGRRNFIANFVWEKRTSRENRRVFSFNHDHILVYARSKREFEKSRNPLPLSEQILQRYRNPDDDPRGPWQSVSANAQAGHATASQFYELVAPNGTRHVPPNGRCWLYTEERMQAEIEANNIYFGASGNNVPRIKKFLRDQRGAGMTPETLWRASDVSTNDHAKKHLKQLFDGEVRFDTPKPEPLISRIIHIASSPGDIVLDSFLGSGTTAAVAHKMRRRWIGIELGEHARTCAHARLVKVIDGHDPGGVTDETEWVGGGGFRYLRLAPSLLEEDKWGNWVINRAYNKEMLAEAMCKLEGFSYAPSDAIFWMHGHSTETDYIYVTTQTLTQEQLAAISAEVGPDRTLLICCSAFRANAEDFDNLTVRRIPVSVLARCEWGRDDYSLNVEAVMEQEPPAEDEDATQGEERPRSTARLVKVQELPLFAGTESKGEDR